MKLNPLFLKPVLLFILTAMTLATDLASADTGARFHIEENGVPGGVSRRLV